MDAVCKDFETAPIAPKEKALFRYLTRLNREPWTVRKEHVDALLAEGWTEKAVYDAATVCAMFNFFNRWIDGLGVPDVPADLYAKRLQQFGDMGYAM